MPEQSDYRFDGQARLSTVSQFAKVLQSGKRVRHPALQLAYAEGDKRCRLGMTVPKRAVRFAHDRNRLKRLIRESFRHRQHQLPPLDIVVVVKQGLGEMSNQEILEVLSKQWKRIVRQFESRS